MAGIDGTTNLPGGITNAVLNSPFVGMTAPDPTLFHTYFNDFNDYTAGDWVVTETNASATEALTAGDGGLLLITNTAADDDAVTMQKTPAAFAMSATKRAWFSARLKVSDATQSDVQAGIIIVDTTPLDATDGIYFLKSDGSASVSVICRKNATTGSNTVSAVTTMADDTFITLQWYYNGAGRLFYGADNVQLGSMDASSTYLPDATNLTVSFTLQNGEAVAKTMTVDYMFAAFER
jgi:hypothetical protein